MRDICMCFKYKQRQRTLLAAPYLLLCRTLYLGGLLRWAGQLVIYIGMSCHNAVTASRCCACSCSFRCMAVGVLAFVCLVSLAGTSCFSVVLRATAVSVSSCQCVCFRQPMLFGETLFAADCRASALIAWPSLCECSSLHTHYQVLVVIMLSPTGQEVPVHQGSRGRHQQAARV
jgi:hypothetical protein